MKQMLDAIYENGVFRPLERPKVSEGQRVRLIVETPPDTDVDDMLRLAAEVYDGLSTEQIEEIEKIALDRSRRIRGLLVENWLG